MQPTTTSADASPQRGRRRRLAALVASVGLVAACSNGGSDAEAITTVAPTTTTTTAATTTTEVTLEEAGEAFQALIEDAQDAITEEDADRTVFADDTDVEGAVGSAGGLRKDLEAFQADLVDLEAPADAQDAIDGVDDATTAYIEVLTSSDYCVQDGDLPDAFLPPTGQDNMSNALSYTFDEGQEADYADALVASWMVLPEGPAGPDDLTADCLIHIFDSPEAAEGFYDAWTADYGSGSFPVPQLAVVADDAPGEDPQAYTKFVGDRPEATQIFRYANVVVSVGMPGTANNDIETTLTATNALAKTVHARLQAAG